MPNLFRHLTAFDCHAELVSASQDQTLNHVQGDGEEAYSIG